jgi:hypothetical protein
VGAYCSSCQVWYAGPYHFCPGASLVIQPDWTATYYPSQKAPQTAAAQRCEAIVADLALAMDLEATELRAALRVLVRAMGEDVSAVLE